ncbi:hypothetical protein PF005_g4749 [Phytophthora fragariae]|uniref:Uncharacterized protein n=1 Tax=Phytophthora fragariae TaxID=53985 RepID=A0A6A3Z0A2_9STRA|nr:hypothetical protein PF003_g209 [Phytophthora fragariae]KAE9024522.1 hypothetical protein PF011_g3484 [Phytophthora fragariae]KAE9129943.1 hypothetical protein PF010_g4020 [Phytophthora fragariae]KAE9227391.1 hypothetical protein PF005_g4749 [Phytophthora fragariae]
MPQMTMATIQMLVPTAMRRNGRCVSAKYPNTMDSTEWPTMKADDSRPKYTDWSVTTTPSDEVMKWRKLYGAPGMMPRSM